jgi:peptidoglycan-associated lipoprotein
MYLTKSKYFLMFLMLSFIIIFSGCAKKTAKYGGSGISAGNITEDGVLEESSGEIITEGQVRRNIENALGELEELYSSSTEGSSESMNEKAILEERTAVLRKVNKMVRDTGTLLPVFFDYDRYSVREDARDTLKNNAEWLSDHPSLKILVAGHADNRGSNEYNLALGDRRAKSVLHYLTDYGVNAEIRTVTFGEEKPFCLESFESCWSQNRRAEFAVVAAD